MLDHNVLLDFGGGAFHRLGEVAHGQLARQHQRLQVADEFLRHLFDQLRGLLVQTLLPLALVDAQLRQNLLQAAGRNAYFLCQFSYR
jgi:hypothetical protein